MRTNPKALTIGVIGIPLDTPTLQRFRDKGHTVEEIESEAYRPCIPDVYIGPRCWRVDPHMRLGDDSTEEESLERQLEMMEKGVRAIKFPKEVKSA